MKKYDINDTFATLLIPGHAAIACKPYVEPESTGEASRSAEITKHVHRGLGLIFGDSACDYFAPVLIAELKKVGGLQAPLLHIELHDQHAPSLRGSKLYGRFDLGGDRAIYWAATW